MKRGNPGKLFLIACAIACAVVLIRFALHVRAPHTPSTPALLSQAGPTFTLEARPGWTLIAYGDMRFTDPADTTDSYPKARQALVAKIGAEKPDLLLLSGDVPFHGGDANDYSVYQQETEPWRSAGLKVFPAMGNHELSNPGVTKACSDCLENWWKNFPELKGRRWYSVRFDPAYVITVDSNLDLTSGSEQSQWVAEQLNGLPRETRYVFVSLHHPPMADPIVGDPSHNVRPNEDALAHQLEAEAPHLQASIVVVAGHIHNYQRFQRNGVIYLVSGGGGARPYPIARTPADLYQDDVFPIFHYIKFVSEAGSLRATMYRLDDQGSFVPGDSFTVGAASQAATR